MNTRTSVGSISARVRSKILMFDAGKVHIFSACARSLLDFDAQLILYEHFIPFLYRKKDFFFGVVSIRLSVCLMPACVCSEILKFELA